MKAEEQWLERVLAWRASGMTAALIRPGDSVDGGPRISDTARRMAKGGLRDGAGRKPRVKDDAASVRVKLSITDDELTALEVVRPPGLPLAVWLRSVIFDALFRRCDKCSATILPDGRGVYGRHACKGSKK